jgi:hypothetical protein
MNPRVKEKVKKVIDKMPATGLIFLVDEAECIIPLVIQSNNGIDDIILFEYYIIFNVACVHDPFPTPFSY